MPERVKVIYKITYPNGKIYVGMDLTGTLLYFGSPNVALIAADFTHAQRCDFTIRKQILWEGTGPDSEVRSKEVHLIRLLRSNDPEVGTTAGPGTSTRLAMSANPPRMPRRPAPSAHSEHWRGLVGVPGRRSREGHSLTA